MNRKAETKVTAASASTVHLPEITWEYNGIATEVAKVYGVAIGHVALRGRPDGKNAYEVVLYHSAGEKNSWSGKPTPAAIAHVGPGQDKARFQRMVKNALTRNTPSDVLTVARNRPESPVSDAKRMQQIHDELATIESEGAAMTQREATPSEIADLNVRRAKLRTERGCIVHRRTRSRSAAATPVHSGNVAEAPLEVVQ
ncbi:hypothetical protein [Paraburkholderia sp. J8-2]|uniref:hypothetical protein n=1 Tax=Paraburkholderia sp. J8-2 TaxID=2805440 RepID=UPI002AB7131E|nr:hypothetical protein [Paraburkholderia sp. J8-2]